MAILLFKKITSASCDKAIRHWFEPYATELELRLERIPLGESYCSRNGVDSRYEEILYEISSPCFTLRIRAGQGPWTYLDRPSLIVTLVRTEARGRAWEDLDHEYAVEYFADYHGECVRPRSLNDQRDFWKEAKRLSEWAKKYCTPILLGDTRDFMRFSCFADGRKAELMAKGKTVLDRFPRAVKRWD